MVSGWVFAGFYMAIFYAAFQQIPTSVLEAAQLDGAGGFRVFWHVKVPMVRHAVEVALLLCITGGFQSFDLFYVLTNGGPYNSTEIPTTYLVKVVFRNQEVGYGSAMAVILTAVVLGDRPALHETPLAALGAHLMVRSDRQPSAVPHGDGGARRALRVPDDLDGAVQLQVQPGDVPRPTGPAVVDRLRRVGRRVAGRQPRALRAQQRDRHQRSRCVAILLFAALAAYAFSRFEFRGSAVLLGLLLLGLLMPLQSYFIAQNSMFDELGLKDTRLALILPYTAMGLPLAVYLLKVFLDALPDELFDAARLDGCGDLRMFTALVLPLLKPGLATVAIFSALNAWNEFLLALLYISDDALKTLPTGLLAFSDRYTTDYQLLFSALSIITLPMVAVYVVFHRQIVAGVTEGAVR